MDIEVEQHDWARIQQAYRSWQNDIYHSDPAMKPTELQSHILDVVHRRRVYEYCVEQSIPHTPESEGMSTMPLYRLIHGLPGSGKSQVLLWVRDYFETVWHWTHGEQFVFVASMNSMADNIGG